MAGTDCMVRVAVEPRVRRTSSSILVHRTATIICPPSVCGASSFAHATTELLEGNRDEVSKMTVEQVVSGDGNGHFVRRLRGFEGFVIISAFSPLSF
jgi:hypothetical protein